METKGTFTIKQYGMEQGKNGTEGKEQKEQRGVAKPNKAKVIISTPKRKGGN